MCGLIVQLPLPKHIDRRAVTEAIDLNIDVDSLTEKNSTQFYSGQKALIFPAALAVLEILDSTQIDLKSKNIVMLGEGELVGKPVAYLLRNRGLAVTTINKSTENKKEILKNADVIISAIGVPKFLSGDMIKEGSIIIDAGTSESEGGIAGDVDFESVKDVAGYISPVPGGVGPVTVSMLLQNVLEVAESKL
jgi:methylenetetrahydrofolate dehydrogenase (NADP+)/methenyltetrahydrofolate cyclohydrolase